jgi:hypothetical protein
MAYLFQKKSPTHRAFDVNQSGHGMDGRLATLLTRGGGVVAWFTFSASV